MQCDELCPQPVRGHVTRGKCFGPEEWLVHAGSVLLHTDTVRQRNASARKRGEFSSGVTLDGHPIPMAGDFGDAMLKR